MPTHADVDYLNDDEQPMTCGDCGRPTLYSYADEQYHHALNAETGCFLIRGEDRPDDFAHPLLGRVEVAR